MTQQDKELLLQDLSARLPYGVKVDVNFYDATKELSCDLLKDFIIDEKSIRPYLRPMSSMTEEEKVELRKSAIAISYNYKDEIIGLQHNTFEQMNVCCNWLNSHHFDYRGLIEKGLALEAKEDMYNLK